MRPVAAVLLSALALNAACAGSEGSPAKSTIVPLVRFVDVAARPDRGALRSIAYEAWRRMGGSLPVQTHHLSVATIDDDTRYVVHTPPTAFDAIALGDLRRESGFLVYEFPLPATFVRSRRAVVRAAARAGVYWFEPHGAGVVAVTPGADDGLSARLALPEAAIEPGATSLFVEVLGESDALSEYETGTLNVPPGARLKFATGLLPATASDAKVQFVIEACDAAGCREMFRDERESAGEKGAAWRDHSLPLDQLAGRSVSLRFHTGNVAGATSAPTFPVWANPTVYVPAARRRPSVILISLDTLRADRLTTYGYRHDTAPFLDATFAKSGTVFEDCISSAASTPPGHMTMMTSLDPSRHGVRRGAEALDLRVSTIAEALRADGVTTGAVTEDGWLFPGQGFGRGFDSYRENRSADVQTPRGEIEKTLSQAAAWIATHGDSPYFLFVHTYQVHAPYTPPPAYERLFVADGAEPSDSDRYDQEIRFTDDQLRAFFSELKRLGELDDLVVIVTSDHGEAFGEHGYVEHSSALHQEITHVPCLLWGAGVPRGLRVKPPVGLIDLAPTIARWMGAPLLRGFHGVDLSPLLQDGSAPLAAKLRDRLVFSEAWGDMLQLADHSFARVVAPGLAVRRGSLKLIRTENDHGPRYEAYDLATDPRERNDLLSVVGENAALSALRATIDDYLAMARRNLESAASTSPLQQPGTAAGEAPALAPDTENKLRALGYLQ